MELWRRVEEMQAMEEVRESQGGDENGINGGWILKP